MKFHCELGRESPLSCGGKQLLGNETPDGE